MNIFFRLLHFLNESPELCLSVCIDPDVVIVRENRFPGLQIIKDQIPEPVHLRIGKAQPFVVYGFLLPSDCIFHFPFDFFCFEHPALMEILSDNQVEDKS